MLLKVFPQLVDAPLPALTRRSVALGMFVRRQYLSLCAAPLQIRNDVEIVLKANRKETGRNRQDHNAGRGRYSPASHEGMKAPLSRANTGTGEGQGEGRADKRNGTNRAPCNRT